MCGCANLSWWLKENRDRIAEQIGKFCEINPKAITLNVDRYTGMVYIGYRPNQYLVPLAQFNMHDFHNTESIAVVSRCFVVEKFRNLRLGQYLHRLRIEFAKSERINFLMATTLQENAAQNHIMEKNGWKVIKEYTTNQYKQKMYLWILDVDKAPSEH